MNSLRIHYLQHVPFEHPGYMATWAEKHRFPLTCTKLYESTGFPDLSAFDSLIIMGGPMSVNDENIYPWLKEEKAFIRSAIDADRYVIGVCLGAQLIADVLGAKVFACRKKEIGWFPVSKTKAGKNNPLLRDMPDNLSVMHWHGETFDIPQGAVNLMKTEICEHQAFLYGEKVLGLQFHMEFTPESLMDMVKNCGNELIEDDYVQAGHNILSNSSLCETANKHLDKLLNFFCLQNNGYFNFGV